MGACPAAAPRCVCCFKKKPHGFSSHFSDFHQVNTVVTATKSVRNTPLWSGPPGQLQPSQPCACTSDSVRWSCPWPFQTPSAVPATQHSRRNSEDQTGHDEVLVMHLAGTVPVVWRCHTRLLNRGTCNVTVSRVVMLDKKCASLGASGLTNQGEGERQCDDTEEQGSRWTNRAKFAARCFWTPSKCVFSLTSNQSQTAVWLGSPDGHTVS